MTTAPVSGSGDPSGLSPEVDSAGTDPADQRERTGEIPGESTEQTFEFNALMVATLQYSTGETGSFTHLGAPGNFQDGVEGYLGFRFLRNNGAGPYYGWMRVTLTANTAGAIIHDWAWESSGGSISAGRAPEPASWLSVLAAASIALLRQRQRQR
ncbi:MAG: PEP-CTERM sorting domain-containing protein [Verrucomicrobiota bacterium]